MSIKSLKLFFALSMISFSVICQVIPLSNNGNRNIGCCADNIIEVNG